MTTIKKVVLTIIISFLVLNNFLNAQWFITKKDLKENNVNYKDFKAAILTYNGKRLIGYEFLDLQHRKKGYAYALNIIDFDKDKKFKIRNVALPITFFVGITLTNNEREAIVVGNYGTKILKVDLETLKVTTIFKYKRSQPGFRTGSLVVSWKNRVFLSGYFYDSNRYWLGDYVVELKILRNKVKFIKKINLGQIYKSLGAHPKVMQIVSGDTVYFSFYKRTKSRKRGKKQRPLMYLVCYHNGRIKTIDRGYGVGNFAGTDKKIYCSMVYKKDKYETYIKDLNGKSKIKVGKDNISYTYPLISDNSKTITFCTVDALGHKMNIFYAREKDGFKRKELLFDAPVGPMKLSGDGKVYAKLGPNGVRVDFLD